MVAEKKGTTPKQATDAKADKPKRERRPARTLEERIAELQAQAEAKAKKAAEKAQAELDAVESAFVSAEAKLLKLHKQRTELRRAAGWTEDENGDVNVPPAQADETEAVTEDTSAD
jgi:siderophore synthetase component